MYECSRASVVLKLEFFSFQYVKGVMLVILLLATFYCSGDVGFLQYFFVQKKRKSEVALERENVNTFLELNEGICSR